MKPALARLLTRLYPCAWRERYGAEFEEFLAAGLGGVGEFANVMWSALREHIFPTRGGTMDRESLSFGAVVKLPSAFLPLGMSLTALAILLGHIAIYGAVREADEGAAAHLWQLLIAGQLPILAIFLIKWLPRAPRQALGVMAMQAGAVLASMAPVFYFNL